MLKCKLCCSVHFFVVVLEMLSVSCDGREVKALDLKSNGVSPRRFDPCSQRSFALYTLLQTLHSLDASLVRLERKTRGTTDNKMDSYGQLVPYLCAFQAASLLCVSLSCASSPALA